MATTNRRTGSVSTGRETGSENKPTAAKKLWNLVQDITGKASGSVTWKEDVIYFDSIPDEMLKGDNMVPYLIEVLDYVTNVPQFKKNNKGEETEEELGVDTVLDRIGALHHEIRLKASAAAARLGEHRDRFYTIGDTQMKIWRTSNQKDGFVHASGAWVS